jgi:molecular chaperone HtpG
MTDPVDEFATQALEKFGDKPLVSVMRADLSFDASDEEKKARDEQSAALRPLLDRIRVVLQERVQEVRLSDRLTDSPCCLVVPEGGHHAFMERLLRNHGAKVPSQRRILEINGSHPLIGSLQALVAKDPGSAKLTDWIELLYDQALLTEGSALEDPNRFARRMTSLLQEVAGAAVG